MKILKEAYEKMLMMEEEARKQMIFKLASYYAGDQRYYVEKYFKKIDIPVAFTNLTKFMVNKLSLVYKKPAGRTIGDPNTKVDYKGKNDLYKTATEDKNAARKEVERQCNLLGNIAILVLPYKNQKIYDYKIIKYFIPHFDKSDMTMPIGISYPLNTSDMDSVWEHWFPDRHFLTDAQFNELPESVHMAYGIETTENIYGEIPVSFWHSELNFSDFWSSDAEPIMNANEHINMVLTDLNLYLRKQGFAWVYTTGVQDDMIIEVGYEVITKLPDPQSKFETLQFPDKTSAFVDAIKGQLLFLSKTYGVEIELQDTGVPSGFQLVVKRIDSLDNWEDSKDIYRIYERDLYRVERMVSMASWRYELPEYISINYADVELPVDTAEQRARTDWEIANNLTTWAKYYAENIDSDLTPEEAQKVIEENALANKNVKVVATPQTALDRLLQ